MPLVLRGLPRHEAEAGYADLLAWLRPGAPVTTAPPAPCPIHWPDPDPSKLPVLADRKEEFALFEQMITGRCSERVLLLKGPSNSGKTLLTGEMSEYARNLGVAVAHVDVKSGLPMDDIFGCIRLDLGQGLLPSSYDASGSARFRNLVEDLARAGQPVLLAFDTWEQSLDETRTWMESQFLRLLDRMPGVVTLVGGQRVPDCASRPWRRLVHERELHPISCVADWTEYSRRRWPSAALNEHHVESLVLYGQGNPGVIADALSVVAGKLLAANAGGRA